MKYNEPLKYKTMCEMFNDEQAKGSKGRQLQLRKWQQYYDIDKIGTNYFIKRKYNEDELDLIENSGKYTSYITDRLLEYLVKYGKEEITISYYDIYELCFMVNKSYHISKNNMYDENKRNIEINKFNFNIDDYLKEELNITDKEMIKNNLNAFFRVSNKLLKQNVKNALKSMQSKGLILYRESFILYKKPTKSNSGDLICYPPHNCNSDEESIMLDLQDEARRFVGVKSKKELYFQPIKIQNKYYEYLLLRIKQEFGYDGYSSAVKIVQGVKAVEHEFKFNKSTKINKNTQKQMLESKEMSQKVYNYLCNQFVNEYVRK